MIHNESEKHPPETETLQQAILQLIASSPSRLTPQIIGKKLAEKYMFSRKHLKSAMTQLLNSGELNYSYEHGCSFLECSFNRPVRVSGRIILTPPDQSVQPATEDIVIRMNAGAAFGAGHHPTTRLALRGIDFAAKEMARQTDTQFKSVLDIGTGSGVLVIAAVMFGINTGVGIDIESCARVEARQNVMLNGLADRITIADKSLECMDQEHSMVLANLRYPTLKRYASRIASLTMKSGFVVTTGVRPPEFEELKVIFEQYNFESLWQNEELNWSAAVLYKK